MILDANKIEKLDDLINSEGTILGLYKYNNQYYLGSYLSDSSGTLYYSVSKKDLQRYIDSKIKLKELYLLSEDFIVIRKYRSDYKYYLQKDMIELITFSEMYFNEIDVSMRNTFIKL